MLNSNFFFFFLLIEKNLETNWHILGWEEGDGKIAIEKKINYRKFWKLKVGKEQKIKKGRKNKENYWGYCSIGYFKRKVYS